MLAVIVTGFHIKKILSPGKSETRRVSDVEGLHGLLPQKNGGCGAVEFFKNAISWCFRDRRLIEALVFT